MASVIKSEWHRGIYSWRFWVTVALALFLFLFAMFQYANPAVHQQIPRMNNFYTATLAMLGSYFEALWPVLIPLAAALPTGDSLAVDRRRGADTLAITRVGWASYLWGKLVGNALVSMVAIATAMVLAMGLAALMYPLRLPRFLGWTVNNALPYHVKISGVFGHAYPPAFHPHLFWAAPGLYLGLTILVALWATAILSGLAVLAAIWIRPPILTLAAPAVVFFLGDVVGQSTIFAGHLVPSVYAGAYLWWRPPLASWETIFFYWAIAGLVIAAVVGWQGMRRREWPTRSVGQ